MVITSNNERELPDAFLRRCAFHFIEFPTQEQMTDIVDVHFPKLGPKLLEGALKTFYAARDVRGVRKPPSTSELIDWIAALLAQGVDPNTLTAELPLPGVLFKREQDLALAQQAFGS